MMTVLSPVATPNELNVKMDNTLHSMPLITERSPAELSLAHLVSVSRNIGDANNAYANSPSVELMPPSSTNNIIPSETKAELAQRLTDSQQGSDIDKIEQAVAGVATLCSARLFSRMEEPSRRSENEKTGEAAMTTAVEHSAERVRSHAVVDGDTDRTPTNIGGYRYSNVMGNTGILDAFTDILRSLNRQEAHFNAVAAQWSHLAMTSANAAGQHLVRSARENQTGAIAGGALSMGIQGKSVFSVTKALKKESASLNNNMKRSYQINEQATETGERLQRYQNRIASDGGNIDEDAVASLQKSITKLRLESADLDNRHRQVSSNVTKSRVQADTAMQVSRSVSDITERTYGITAAEQSKQAEIMRANQTVSGEVDSVHQQTSKKSSEGESALRQALLAILNNNNDAVSAVASKMA